MESQAPELLDIDDLKITFVKDGKSNPAVKGISFSIRKGETLAIVGESGSGKTVTALSLTRLLPRPPGCQVSGSVRYGSDNLLEAPEKKLRHIRGKDITYIFQEPSTSMSPVFTVGYQIGEAIKRHSIRSGKIRERVCQALEAVGIPDPERCRRNYPHEMSGGMLQRAMIAMAIACEPKILVADEPTTALDVTIQKQIIDLLSRLQKENNMAVILITHNFGIVSGFAERVVVMYDGRVVEQGETKQILQNPSHPYTRELIDCIPRIGQKQHRLKTIDRGAKSFAN